MIDRLMELGLGEYEAKAYLALLESNPVSAYETAKRAGIPTSKVYEVLDRLVARGIVQSYEDGDRKKFVPLDAEQFLDAQSVRLSTTIGELRKGMGDLGKAQAVSLVWNVRDYRSLTDYLGTVIDAANKNLLLSAWAEEIPLVRQAVLAAKARGVQVALVLFGEGNADIADGLGQIFPHPIGDTLYSEKGGRGITAVSDGKQALVATISGAGAVEGAWSRNAGFVTLAEDYVKHDIYIMKIVERFDADLIRKFGDGYRRLRDVFLDTEE